MSQNDVFKKWFTVGDTARAIADTLTDSTGGAIDLTGSTVKFLARPTTSGSSLTINTSATIDGSTSGTVSYSWATADVATAGEYYYCWLVTVTATSKVEHFPGDGFGKRLFELVTQIETT